MTPPQWEKFYQCRAWLDTDKAAWFMPYIEYITQTLPSQGRRATSTRLHGCEPEFFWKEASTLCIGRQICTYLMQLVVEKMGDFA